MSLELGARLGAAVVGRRVLRRSYLGPLLEKSRALTGATVTLHGVKSAPRMGSELPRGHEAGHLSPQRWPMLPDIGYHRKH